MNILCFGDSNTYGYRPDGTGRFDEKTRWTYLLQKKFGNGHRIIEEGLCGRTTIFSDAFREGRRGLDQIGITIETHNPIDLLVLMLGTNDCKTRFNASSKTIAKGLIQVIEKAKKYSSQPFELLIISPIHLGNGVGDDALILNSILRLNRFPDSLHRNIGKLLLIITPVFWTLQKSLFQVKLTGSIWMNPVMQHLQMLFIKQLLKVDCLKKGWTLLSVILHNS